MDPLCLLEQIVGPLPNQEIPIAFRHIMSLHAKFVK
jgi:hypothetical protein